MVVTAKFSSLNLIVIKKEKGNLDINLDIEMKIRTNRHYIFVEIMRNLEKLKSARREEKG